MKECIARVTPSSHDVKWIFGQFYIFGCHHTIDTKALLAGSCMNACPFCSIQVHCTKAITDAARVHQTAPETGFGQRRILNRDKVCAISCTD